MEDPNGGCPARGGARTWTLPNVMLNVNVTVNTAVGKDVIYTKLWQSLKLLKSSITIFPFQKPLEFFGRNRFSSTVHKLIHPRFAECSWNSAFASEILPTMSSCFKITKWVFGHSHSSANAVICGVSYTSNPVDIPTVKIRSTKKDLIVKIDDLS